MLAAFPVLTIAAERAELAQLALDPGPPHPGRRLDRHHFGGDGVLIWQDAGGRLFGATPISPPPGYCATTSAPHDPRRWVALVQRARCWPATCGWPSPGSPGSSSVFRTPAPPTTWRCTGCSFRGVDGDGARADHLPAVLGRDLPYRRLFWLPLGVLHASVAVRFVGDLTGMDALWQAGGGRRHLTVAVSVVDRDHGGEDMTRARGGRGGSFARDGWAWSGSWRPW